MIIAFDFLSDVLCVCVDLSDPGLAQPEHLVLLVGDIFNFDFLIF